MVALVVKNLPVNGDVRDASSTLSREDPLEESMAIHSSILAWRIPWTGIWQAVAHGVTKSWTRLSDQVQHTQDELIMVLRI